MSEDMDIEDLLRDNLREEEVAVPAALFGQIEATILAKEKRKKLLFILLWIGIGLSILLGGWLWGKHSAQCHCKNQIHLSKMTSQLPLPLKTKANTNVTLPVEIDSALTQENEAVFIELDNFLTSATTHLPSNEKKDAQVLRSESFLIQANTTSTAIEHQQPIINKSLPEDSPPLLNEANLTSLSQPLVTKQLDDRISQTSMQLQSDSLVNSAITSTENTADTLPVKDTSLVETKTPINPPLTDTSTTISSLREKEAPPEKDTIEITQEPDSLPTQKQVQKSGKTAFNIYAGPTAYDVAVFKPYFNSGVLSPRNFKSRGIEFGVGISQKLGQKLSLQFMSSFNQKKSQFNYDLMISEADYFELYLLNQPIPIENLDDPNSCNCFLAEDIELNYQISTLALDLGIEYPLLSKGPFNLGVQLKTGTNAVTQFKSNAQNGVLFATNLNENFNTLRLNMGLTLGYNLTEHVALGIAPFWSYQTSGSSVIYAKNVSEIGLPIQFKYTF